MGNVWTIFKRDFRSYWNSPVAYVVLVLFLLITGYFFTMIFNAFVQYSGQYAQLQYQYPNAPPPNASEFVFRSFFGVVVLLEFIFLIPLLTMRLVSEEKSSGTIELLFTYPVRDREIVWGKFLSALAFLAVMVLITLVYPLMVHLINPGAVNLRVLAGGYLGFFLMGAVFVAIGLLFSSMTKNQIVAATLTVGTLLLLYVTSFVREYEGLHRYIRGFIGYISFFTHYESFTKGVIATHDVVYCLVAVAFSLFLTQRIVEVHRWKG